MTAAEVTNLPTTAKRGFACLTPERRRAIASMGGKKAHALGLAHKFTSDEARDAAVRGHALGKCHQFTSEEAVAAGRKSGLARAKKYRGK